MLCDGRNLLQLETENPFGPEPPTPISFVSSAFCRRPAPLNAFACHFPQQGESFVRLIEAKGKFVFGTYRRRMKTITYLGKIDKLFGVPATTRNWNTIEAVSTDPERPRVMLVARVILGGAIIAAASGTSAQAISRARLPANLRRSEVALRFGCFVPSRRCACRFESTNVDHRVFVNADASHHQALNYRSVRALRPGK